MVVFVVVLTSFLALSKVVVVLTFNVKVVFVVPVAMVVMIVVLVVLMIGVFIAEVVPIVTRLVLLL